MPNSLSAKLPSAFRPDIELAIAHATVSQPGADRPYKSSNRGHVDFVREEYLSLLYTLDSIDQAPYQAYAVDTSDLRRQLKTKLGLASQERMTAIIRTAQSGSETALIHRKKKSIRTFLIDLTQDAIPPSVPPRVAVPRCKVKDKALMSRTTSSSLLRAREVGSQDQNQRITLTTQVAESIRPWRSWRGASGDVVTVAWTPNSQSYAVGAAAQSDNDDLQYNRPFNLLFGDIFSNTIRELPDHHIERPKPNTIESGPNSTYAVYQACDPMVYKTVTSVQFSPCGRSFYTASHDNTAKIWDTSSGFPACCATINHEAEVTSLEVSYYYPKCFATASKSIENAIRVYKPQRDIESQYIRLDFSSPRALKHPSRDIFPECLRWGLTPGTKHLLLAGFQQWADQDFSAARQGQICLWDVDTGANLSIRPHASAIFSIAWHPTDDIFATGGAPGGGPLSFPGITKSVVRTYDTRNTSSYSHELECPALDIQDVTFHPANPNYITAGCTNGTTYVWDRRWPDAIMHELHHGVPLQELAANEEDSPFFDHREKVDAGVMLSIWGSSASLFYSGSSDGVIKAWDIMQAPEDVWMKDIACLPAGIQSGALSPDGMNMLVGDAVGGVHLLSAAPFDLVHSDLDDDQDVLDYNPDPIKFVYPGNKDNNNADAENPGTEGIETVRGLVQSGQMVVHPSFGAGKGPNYQGPLADSARWQNVNTGYNELLPNFDKQQAFCVNGFEQPEQSSRIKTLIAARKAQMLAAKQNLKPFVFTNLGPPMPFIANRRPSRDSVEKSTTGAIKVKPQANDLNASPHPPLLPRTTTPTATSPSKSTASNPIDLTNNSTTSPPPCTGQKRKRPSTPSSPAQQPSTPTNSQSKRVKLEYISPLKYPFKHIEPANTAAVEVVDLTADDAERSSHLGLTRVLHPNADDGAAEARNMGSKRGEEVV